MLKTVFIGFRSSICLIHKIYLFIYFDFLSIGLVSNLLRCFMLIYQSFLYEFLDKNFRLTIKRLIVLWMLSLCLPVLIVWNHVGYFLDDIIYPQWKKQAIHQPIFIIGNARSGTTLCHRSLASDDTMFTSLRTWEIIFGVSVTWRRLILMVYLIDNLFGGPVYSIISKIEKHIVRNVTIHPIGLQLAEEDEWLLAHIGLSQLLMLILPLTGDTLNPLVTFDLSLSRHSKAKIMRFYKEAVQRHIYGRRAASKVFISKNPAFTLRLGTLLEVFPDARVVCMVRDPVRSVPSLVSYLSHVWHVVASPTVNYPRTQDLLAFSIAHYCYPLEYLSPGRLPVDQWAFCHYRSLVHESTRLATVSGLLRRLRICQPLSPSEAIHSRFLSPDSGTYVSGHMHSPELCCGMSRTQLRELMSEVYAAYDFPPDTGDCDCDCD